MKKTLSAALIAAALAQPVLAQDARQSADRKDVAQAQADADNMSALEATGLKARVILAEIVLAELRFNQSLMDKVGADHTRNAKTIPLGLTRSALTLAAGAASLYYLPKMEYLQFDKEVGKAYSVIADKRRELSATEAELKKSVATVDGAKLEEKTAREAALTDTAATKRAELDTLIRNVNTTEKLQPWYKREWKPVRLVLAPTLGVLLIADGVSSLAQIVIDPAYGDDLEARLTRFVDDANDTLDRR